MEEIKEYLNFQIEHMERWEREMKLSEYGKGKLYAFKDVLKQLTIPVVIKSLPLIEGKTKSNINKHKEGRQAPPPPPVRTIKGNVS